MSAHPTLINLPPPPADPVTPSDMGPGTPNSATTTMSELSTVAIKDGHRGHINHHHTHQQTDPLDAERADRISRLAGLERVVAARHPNNPYSQGFAGSTGGQSSGAPPPNPPAGYFDNAGNPQLLREKSTVGSASATGSVGGRTTWASGSEVEGDRMSEQGYSTAGGDPSEIDMDTSSVGGTSTTNIEGLESESLVGFGEGARTPARTMSPGVTKTQPTDRSTFPSHLRDTSGNQGAGITAGKSPMSGVSTSTGQQERNEARFIDGVTYDEGVLDTAVRTPPPVAGGISHAQGQAQTGRSPLSGVEAAEKILGGRLEPAGTLGRPEETENGAKSLGKFDFEGK